MKNFTKQTLFILLLFISFTAYTQQGPKLSSLATAPATIFLDFDGQTVTSASWNGGTKFTCGASGMSDAQITEMFDRVAEDYRPFNVNVTTDSTIFLAAPLNRRIRIIVWI